MAVKHVVKGVAIVLVAAVLAGCAETGLKTAIAGLGRAATGGLLAAASWATSPVAQPLCP